MPNDDRRNGGPWITLALCGAVAVAALGYAWQHRRDYADLSHYSPKRVQEIIDEEIRLNNPDHPKNPYREIERWYEPTPAPARTPSR